MNIWSQNFYSRSRICTGRPPAVEAAVVGATDETTGQSIIGYVILRVRRIIDLRNEIRSHVATKLGPIAS